MMSNARLLGMGLPPPPPPPPPHPHHHGGGFGPMIWPPYQPTVYVQSAPLVEEAPCKWYEDLQGSGSMAYCRAPAMWLVLAAVGAITLYDVMRRRG